MTLTENLDDDSNNFCTICQLEVGNKRASIIHTQKTHPELFYLVLGHVLGDDEYEELLLEKK